LLKLQILPGFVTKDMPCSFYTDDGVLLDELAALFRAALGKGQSVATIMTSSHLKRLGEAITRAKGVDVSEATQKNGRLYMLDADQAV